MTAIKKLAPFADTFSSDVESWFLRKRSGHMIRHYYSGNALRYWELFTTASSDYYLFDEEAELIHKEAPYLADKYSISLKPTLVELGTGGPKSARRKTIPFLTAFNPTEYIAVDWSNESASIVSAIIEMELGIKTSVHVADFNTGLFAPSNDRKILFQLGSTISNIECFPNEGLPLKNLVANLANYNRNMREGDLLVIGFDQNNDEQSLIKAYSHPHHDVFSKSILHRIKSELPISKNFDPDLFYYRPIWKRNKSQLIHALVAKKDMHFLLGAQAISFKEGEFLSYDNSFKFSQGLFEGALKLSGLKLLETVRSERISLQIITKE